MLHDQHAHTSYSVDSEASLEEYYKIAFKYNRKYFITTEHIEFDSMYNFQDWTVDYVSMKKELSELREKYPTVTPLLGVEIGYRKDHLEDMKRVINSESFDLINMSIHDNGKYDYYMQESFKDLGTTQMLDIYFNNIIDALNTFHDFDVLSHFDYGFKTAYVVNSNLRINDYEIIVRQIFKKVIALNKVLEINTKVQNILGVEHLKTWLTWYLEEGGTKLCLSSDAHTEKAFDNYYENQSEYMSIIKSIGFKDLRYFINRKEYIYKI